MATYFLNPWSFDADASSIFSNDVSEIAPSRNDALDNILRCRAIARARACSPRSENCTFLLLDVLLLGDDGIDDDVLSDVSAEAFEEEEDDNSEA